MLDEVGLNPFLHEKNLHFQKKFLDDTFFTQYFHKIHTHPITLFLHHILGDGYMVRLPTLNFGRTVPSPPKSPPMLATT